MCCGAAYLSRCADRERSARVVGLCAKLCVRVCTGSGILATYPPESGLTFDNDRQQSTDQGVPHTVRRHGSTANAACIGRLVKLMRRLGV